MKTTRRLPVVAKYCERYDVIEMIVRTKKKKKKKKKKKNKKNKIKQEQTKA